MNMDRLSVDNGSSDCDRDAMAGGFLASWLTPILRYWLKRGRILRGR